MDFVANVTDDIRVWGTGCSIKSSSITATYSVFFLDLLFIHLATKFLHEFLRRYGQPRIVSDFIVGILVGNVKWIGSALEQHVGRVLKLVGQSSMMCYMFVLGLEMEPRAILRHPCWEAIIAYSGIFSTFLVTFASYPALVARVLDVTNMRDARFVFSLALILSNTASPILTRLTTELKIGRTQIGRLVVGAAIVNDMVMTFVASIGLAVLKSPYIDWDNVGENDGFSRGVLGACWALFVIFAQTMFIVVVIPRFAEWINRRNPEGKPMKGFDLALSLALVLGLTQFGSLVNFDPTFNSFLVGLAFPKGGRLSNMLISKINFLITTFGLPYYLCSIGMETHFGSWSGAAASKGGDGKKWSGLISWSKLVLIAAIGTVGKVSGTCAAAMVYGFQFTEATAIGLLLNIKGHFHILCAALALENQFINENTFLVMMFDIIATVTFIPLVVRVVAKRARRSAERPKMTLQGLDATAEVHMVMGILGPQNVPTAISIVEATRGRSVEPLSLYAMDLVELTDRTAMALVQGQGMDSVTDEAIVNLREQISRAFEAYVQEGGEGITVVRLMAISAFVNMHEDVCQAAQETASVLIIMPFHKSLRISGGMENLHPGFRQVNRKVLQHGPCSVGILVDRGLGRATRSAASSTARKVAVIFIGGCDDREALTLAGRVAWHPSFSLTAVRFLPEPGAETRLARTRGLIIETKLQEKEMQLDDECFAGFFESHIAGGRVTYLEKYISSGADAVVALRALEGQYSLFIVGRGGSRNPVLTAGMGDWAECPELGPVGDILSSADYSETASVLIIQQHDVGREQEATDEDFAFN